MVILTWAFIFFQILSSNDVSDVNVQRITIRNGLPSNYVKQVYAANTGDIWVSTDFGLSLIRGPKIENFNSQFSSAYVKQVYRASNKRTYVIGNGDFMEIVPTGSDFTFIPVINVSKTTQEHSLNTPDRIFEDNKGTFWISEQRSFSKLVDGELTRFETGEKFQSFSVYRNFLFQNNGDSEVLISAHAGYFWLYDYKTDSVQELKTPALPTGFGVETLFQIGENRYLVGSDVGLYEAKIVDHTLSFKKISEIKQVVDIIFDKSEKSLLLATKSTGIYSATFDDESLTVSERIAEVAKIKSICLDNEGNLWVGSDEGVSIISKHIFSSHELNTLDAFVSKSLVKDDSTFSISSKSQIYEISLHQGEFDVTQKVYLPNAQITAFEWTGSEYYVGLLSGLVLRIEENGKQEVVSQFQNPISDIIWTDRLYIAQEATPVVISITKQNVIKLFGFPSLQNPEIIQITPFNKNKEIYGIVKSEKYSIFRIQSGSDLPQILAYIEPRHPKEIFDILDIQVSDFNRLWIATTQGIAIMDLENPNFSAEWIDLGTDFPFQLIEDIKTESEKNRLWIGAQNGLFLYDEGVLAGYAKDDGMLRDQITSLHLSPNGMVLGHVDGFSVWNSPDFGKSKTSVKVELVSSNNAVTLGESTILEVSRSEQDMFVLPKSYPHTHTTLFWKTKDTRWKQIKTNNAISISELQDGLQTIEIIAVKTGFVASVPMKFSVFVSPNWFNTSWFYSISTILSIFVLLFILKFNKAIIAQRRALWSLREVREQIEAIVQSSPVILMSISKTGEIQLLEGKALVSLHVSPDRYVGEHISMLFQDEAFEKAFSQSLNGKTQQLVLDRNSRSYDLHLIPVMVDNEVVSINAIGVDISSQVQTERELRLATDESEKARLEAERANRAKSQFLANMSHELRTPLNAIIGYSQILTADKQLNERQHQFVDIMQSSGYHLLSMINDILDLSKIESGKLDVNIEVFSPSQILDELDSMFRLQTVEKNLELLFVNNTSTHLRVEGDKHKIRQILLNLISNSIKYTDKGFVKISLSMLQNNGDVPLFSFEVEDSGRGIPKEQIESIFRPFRQVKGLFNSGTGLGLTISKNLTELLGGTIETLSEVGKGSTFTIRIPLKTVEQEYPLAEETRTVIRVNELESPNFLVVDDIKSNRDLLKQMLLSNGFNAKTAASGKKALELLYNESFDLILLDLNMPDLHGEEVLAIIRNEFSSDIPIIAVTAQGFSDSKEHLTELGFDDYVSKPFLWEDLLKSIHKVTKAKFTSELTEKSTSDDFELSIKLPLSFIDNLSEEEKTRWKEALELIDLDVLEKLAVKENVPSALKHAIENKDFKYLLLLEEHLS